MLLVGIAFVAACGSGSSPGSSTGTTGECEPPVDSTELELTPFDLFQSCIIESQPEVQVVDSVAAWNARFDCSQPVPTGLDLTTQRAALVHVNCSPIDYRFTADRTDEVVVGVHQRVSGACLGNVIVVPLPRSTKSVRVATCRDTCGGECPPVP
jgi:hypothetical protein